MSEITVTNTASKSEVISDEALAALREFDHPMAKSVAEMVNISLPVLRQAAESLVTYLDQVKKAEDALEDSDHESAVAYRKAMSALETIETKRSNARKAALQRLENELAEAYGEKIETAKAAVADARKSARAAIVGDITDPESARLSFRMARDGIKAAFKAASGIPTNPLDAEAILRPNFSAMDKATTGTRNSGGTRGWAPRLESAQVNGETVPPAEKGGQLVTTLATVAEFAKVDRKTLADSLEAANGGRDLPVGEPVTLTVDDVAYTLIARDTTNETRKGSGSKAHQATE